jgi:hypothetical protein
MSLDERGLYFYDYSASDILDYLIEAYGTKAILRCVRFKQKGTAKGDSSTEHRRCLLCGQSVPDWSPDEFCSTMCSLEAERRNRQADEPLAR